MTKTKNLIYCPSCGGYYAPHHINFEYKLCNECVALGNFVDTELAYETDNENENWPETIELIKNIRALYR